MRECRLSTVNSPISYSALCTKKTKVRSINVALEVFFSYSHRDEKLRDELMTHLSLLERQGLISGWHNQKSSQV